MNGSVLSRWSRYVRILPSTAMVFGSLLLLPSCAGKAGQNPSTPQPKDTPSQARAPESSKPQAPTPEPSKPKATTPESAQPKKGADPTPTQPSAPETVKSTVTDSATVATQFCKQVKEGVQAGLAADTLDPTVLARKVAASIPDTMATIAVAKDVRCK